MGEKLKKDTSCTEAQEAEVEEEEEEEKEAEEEKEKEKRGARIRGTGAVLGVAVVGIRPKEEVDEVTMTGERQQDEEKTEEGGGAKVDAGRHRQLP